MKLMNIVNNEKLRDAVLTTAVGVVYSVLQKKQLETQVAEIVKQELERRAAEGGR